MAERDATTAETDGDLRSALGMAERPSPARLAPGVVLDGAYRIERELGSGGMGIVYLARDVSLPRDVAIKVHSAITGEDRLVREAEAMARLAHPNVVTVFRVGTWAGHPYVAMEHVAGGTLRGWLARPRSVREILGMFAAIGDGLAAAHRAGLVHRDFKPDNVLIGDDGRPRVADFGLVLAMTSDATDDPSGTPAYMAPEQWDRAAVDARADQYAFAVALWEALHGRRPFAATRRDEQRARLAQPPEPATRGRAPREIDAALRRSLAVDPAARHPDMHSLVAVLRSDRAARRRRAAAVIALAAVAATAVALLFALRGAGPPAPCRAAGDLGAAWSPARRQAVVDALGAVDRPWAKDAARRTADALDRHAAAWSDVSARSCRAARIDRTWPEDVYARSRHCLTRRLRELDATSALLAGGDADVAARALDMVARLPEVEGCADPSLLDRDVAPPSDPALAAQVASLEVELSRIRTLRAAGRYEDGIAAADALAATVDDVAYPPLAAETAELRAGLASDRGDPDALERLARVHLELRRAGLVVHAAEIALRLAILHANRGEIDDADRWWQLGDADVVGLGLGPPQQIKSARAHAAVLDMGGHSDEARPEAQRAIDLAIATYGDQASPDLFGAIDDLATIDEALGDHDAAIALDRRALALAEAYYGPDHPALQGMLGNLGGSLMQAGDDDGALAVQRRALAIARAALAPGSAGLGSAVLNLGLAELAVDPHAAVDHLREALAIYTAATGPDSEDTLYAGLNLGLALGRDGRLDEARSVLEPMAARVEPDTASELEGGVLHNLAALELSEEHFTRARALLEQALAVFERVGSSGTDRGRASADLARALLGLGDARGATVAAERALAYYDGSGIDPDDVATAELRLAAGLWEIGERTRARTVAASADGHADDAEVRKAVTGWIAAHP